MRLLFKILLALIVIAFAGIAGYAYFGDMAPQRSEMRVPVELDLGGGTLVPPAAPAAQDGSQPATGQNEPAANPPAEGENVLD